MAVLYTNNTFDMFWRKITKYYNSHDRLGQIPTESFTCPSPFAVNRFHRVSRSVADFFKLGMSVPLICKFICACAEVAERLSLNVRNN